MSLPANWVDKIFHKLSVTYGQGFMRQYDGVSPEDVKANWGQELACFQQTPTAIGRGLSLLPVDRAPTVLQFRELCRGSAQSENLALPAPPREPVAPEIVAATKAAFKATLAQTSKEWAHRLKERDLRSGGAGMTLFQRKAWREALREPIPEVA